MNTSESIKSIANALLGFQEFVPNIERDSKAKIRTKTGAEYSYTFAGLSKVLESIKKPLSQVGLVVIQSPTSDHSLTTRIVHAESGEWIEDTFTLRPTQDEPQPNGSRITYQKRYALVAMLHLNVDDDDDAKSASQSPQIAPRATKAPAVVKAKVASGYNCEACGDPADRKAGTNKEGKPYDGIFCSNKNHCGHVTWLPTNKTGQILPPPPPRPEEPPINEEIPL